MTTKSTSAFGTVFSAQMSVANFADGQWSAARSVPYEDLRLSPAAHVLHYASTCFEGLKAHRHENGDVRIFRLDKHVKRMIASATALSMTPPNEALLTQLITDAVKNADEIPVTPGALYIRPTMIGTTPNIGSAAAPPSEVLLFVITSPVGDYFGGKDVTLRILVNDHQPRSTPQLGFAKTGGNYAAAMGPIQSAKRAFNADQVLFCPKGDVQETGAANFLLLRDDKILTKPLDDSFLHGVTRDSLLTIAKDMGYEVIEKDFSVSELLDWVKTGEAALSGTAAILSSVGALIYEGKEHQVGNGGVGPNTAKLRRKLVDIQAGRQADQYHWLTPP